MPKTVHDLFIKLCCIIISMMAGSVGPAFAEIGTQVTPSPYQLHRSDENYRYLRDSARSSDFWDPLKYIPINESAGWYLSLGGEARERYEYFSHPKWGAGPPGSGYLLQRYFLHADLHMGENFRVFTQLQSSLETGRVGGPRPTDRDELDLHQGFLDVKLHLNENGLLVLRSGRQEMAFGSQRIISVREGPNMRLSFDGFRAMLRAGGIQLDGFVTKPVENKSYVFDNETDNSRALWGVYSALPLTGDSKANIDLYYLGYNNREKSFDQGSGSENRHSVGTRIWGTAKPIDYNFEFVYQWGKFGKGNIQAWMAASDAGYTFRSLPLHPRLGLKANITSGDRDKNNPDLQTFNPLFPHGAYFSQDNLISTSNQIDLNPSVKLHFTDSLSLSVNWDFLWRESIHDGTYNNGVVLVQPSKDSTARYIGSQTQTQLRWKIDRHITLIAIYAHFFTGKFLQETGPARDVNYVTTWITYRF
jgi:hypothetical protein